MAYFANNSISTMRVSANTISNAANDIIKTEAGVNSTIHSYKDNPQSQVWFGSQMHILDIGPTLINASRVITEYRTHHIPLLGKLSAAYLAVCPTITCRPDDSLNPKYFTNVVYIL
jgi:hypothetical protein